MSNETPSSTDHSRPPSRLYGTTKTKGPKVKRKKESSESDFVIKEATDTLKRISASIDKSSTSSFNNVDDDCVCPIYCVKIEANNTPKNKNGNRAKNN